LLLSGYWYPLPSQSDRKEKVRVAPTYSLNSKKYKKNIPCHKNFELDFPPRVIVRKFWPQMKLCFTCGAV
jgi:hypothetical protein